MILVSSALRGWRLGAVVDQAKALPVGAGLRGPNFGLGSVLLFFLLFVVVGLVGVLLCVRECFG